MTIPIVLVDVDVDVRCPVLVPLLLCLPKGPLWGAVNRIGAKWPPRKTKKKSLLRGSGSDMGYQT